MQTDLFKSVKQRLEGYRSDVEEWKAEHDLAVRCLDFELLLQHGLSIYQAINLIDEAWRRRVLSKQIDFDPEVDELIRGLYEWWELPCDFVLTELDRYEKDFDVTYAEEFREACGEVRGILMDDVEFFSGGDLVTLRDLAVDAHRRSECEPCSE